MRREGRGGRRWEIGRREEGEEGGEGEGGEGEIDRKGGGDRVRGRGLGYGEGRERIQDARRCNGV